MIENAESGAISLASTARTTDTAVSVTVADLADSDLTARAIARSTGLDGGEGNDTLQNFGLIESVETTGPSVVATTVAESKARAVKISALGQAGGNAAGTTEALAIGLDGGGDDDALLNAGRVDLGSSATSSGQSFDFSVAGAALGDATGTGRASAIGLSGGAGDDVVLNTGIVNLRPSTSLTGQSIGVAFAGTSVGDASALAEALATGLFGGIGEDTLSNRGPIEAAASATSTARSTGVVVGGTTLDKANSKSETNAVGIDGGDDADLVTDEAGAAIDVEANASASATGPTSPLSARRAETPKRRRSPARPASRVAAATIG